MAGTTTQESRLAIIELANMISVPMSLYAVVKLKVADAIWQDGRNTPLTAAEIIHRIQPLGTDATNLRRILRMLTLYNVFTEHANATDPSIVGYSLTEVGKLLVTDSEGSSYAAYVIQHHQDALMKAWPLMHTAVKDPTTAPFVVANGEPSYDYIAKQPEMNELKQQAMSAVSVPFMKAMLESYHGFDDVEGTMVDAGGCAGVSLKMIMEKHPNIKDGINFDLPEVVAKAPSFPGITNVPGDMFKSVPSCDAVFMKWVLTAWTNDQCIVVLKNCYKALPEGGKMIVVEPVLPSTTNSPHIRRNRALHQGDIFIMTMQKGKLRTEDEFRQLAYAAGFPGFQAVYEIDDFFTIMEFTK